MSGAASPAAPVAIFTDEPGWHGRTLRRAFAARGRPVVWVSLRDCHFDLADGARVVIPGFDGGLPAGAFVRGVAGGTLEEVVMRLDVLHCLPLLGVPVFNTGRAIERTVDKALTSFLLRRRGLPTPATWVCERPALAFEAARRVFATGGALVMKPLFGSQGEGLLCLRSLADLEQVAPPAGVYYLQEYLARGGPPYRDWRVLVVEGRACAAMERTSEHWVTNRAQGARCTAASLGAEMRELAEAAAAAVDVDYAGVDLLQDDAGRLLVGEVNGVPAWWGLQQATGLDITSLLVDACERKIARAAVERDAG